MSRRSWHGVGLVKPETFRPLFPSLAYRPCDAPDRLTCGVWCPSPGETWSRGRGKGHPGDEFSDVATRDHFVVAVLGAGFGSDAGRCDVVGWAGHRAGFRGAVVLLGHLGIDRSGLAGRRIGGDDADR